MIGPAGRQRHGEGEGSVAPPRRRFREEEEGEATTGRAAANAGCRCRSCAAVAVADCVALACCPCAVVSLLGLALVSAPIAVGRLMIRTTRRRRALLRGKRVRDAASPAPSDDRDKGEDKEKTGDGIGGVETTATTTGGVDDHEAELAWLEEMYRTGRWGLGRFSFSAKTT